MKKGLIAILMVVGFMTASAAVSKAQTVRLIRTSVPFEFNAGGKEMPAGEYVITYGGGPISAGTIIIRSENGKNVATVLVRTELTSKPDSVNGIAFERVNGRYYLDAVTVYSLKLDVELPGKVNRGVILAKRN